MAAGAIAGLSDAPLHYYLGGTADAHLDRSPFKNVADAMVGLADRLGVRLNLGGDATEPDDFNSALGQGTFLVDQVGTSIFSIFERDATIVTDTRNNQPVDSSGTFQNLATPPDLPTIP